MKLHENQELYERFYFGDGSHYTRPFDQSLIEDDEFAFRVELGFWSKPFNKESSFAQGQVESFEQDDVGGCLVAEHGRVTNYMVY